MPVQIGAKPESSYEDPIGLLGDCHRRIERFLSVLVRVARDARGGALNPEQRAACETALRYFREAAPKHTADEEESLFPRLRAMDRPGVRDVLARMEALESDHARAALDHLNADRLFHRWIAAGSLSPEDAGALAAAMGRLAALYRDHIAFEDRELFPTAARALDPTTLAAIGAEVAARRRR
ncbi:MAG: hemerythrin domain-containing protein [Acidobacteria bacterium]|nr:hemerythrin domain-containing protein [Acidobacteriota bacterium]